jgi:hypothetical protein
MKKNLPGAETRQVYQILKTLSGFNYRIILRKTSKNR